MREEKKYLLDAVADPIKGNGTFVLIKYEKVRANSVNQFRRDVAAIGGFVRMMRKRILIRACEAAGIPLDIEQLPGHIGVVFSGQDPIETTKLAFKFSQETDKNAKVIGGRFEGKLYNGKDFETLSKLPGKDEMRAQLLATLEAPMAQTLAVMDALLSSVVYCLDNKTKSEEVSGS